MLFDLRIVTAGEWDVISIVGDLDLASLPSLRQGFDRVESSSVAVDLTGVDHLDPIALGALHLGALRAVRSGGRFVVVCGPGPVRGLLAETGVESVLTVVDGVDALG